MSNQTISRETRTVKEVPAVAPPSTILPTILDRTVRCSKVSAIIYTTVVSDIKATNVEVVALEGEVAMIRASQDHRSPWM